MGEPVDVSAPPPRRRRRWLLRLLVWVPALALALLAGVWWLLQSDFLAERVRLHLTTLAGGLLERDVEVDSLELSLVPLQVEVRGLVIGSDRPGAPPFARVERLLAEADLAGVRQPVLTLRRLEVERPRVHLELRADGTDNIPRLRRSGGGGRRRLEVEIGALSVDEGTFVLDERRLPLSLAARAVRARLLGVGDLAVQGDVAAQDVRLVLPHARPYRASVGAKVILDRGQIDIVQARVAGPELRARGRGRVRWREARDVHVQFDAASSGELLRRLGYVDDEVRGPLALTGTFDWAPAAWGYRARVRSPELELLDRRLAAVAGELSGDREEVRFDIDTAQWAGGALAGRVLVDLRPVVGERAGYPVTVDLTLRDLSLSQLLAEQQIPLERLEGRVRGRVLYELRSDDPRRGSGRAEVAIERVPVGPRDLSLAGTADLRIARGVLASDAIRLAGQGQTVRAQGNYDLASGAGSFDFVVETTDAGELTKLVPVDPDPAGPPVWLPLDGRGNAEGTLRLASDATGVELRLALADVVSRGMSAARLDGGLRVDPRGVEGLWLELGRPGAVLRVAGSIPFEGSRLPFAVTVDSEDWPIEEARPWLPFELPLAGPFHGRVELAGTLETLRGGVVGVVRPARLAEAAVGEVSARVRFDPQRVQIDEVVLRTAAGEIIGSGALELAGDDLNLLINGPELALAEEPFRSWLGDSVAGTVRLAATVSGTLDAPAVLADVRSVGLRYEDRELGADAHVLLRIAGGDLEVEGELPGLLRFAGAGEVSAQSAAVRLDLQMPSLGAVARLLAPPTLPDFAGALAGTAQVAWRAGEAPTVELEVPTLSVVFEGRRLVPLEPVRLRLAGGSLEVVSLYLGEEGTPSEVFVAGAVGLAAPYPLDLRLQSSIATAWVELLVPQLEEVAGTFDVLATIRGTASAPAFNGQGEIRGGRFIVAEFPHIFEEVRATVLLYPSQLVLDSFAARLGTGNVRAGGAVQLGGGRAGTTYRLQLSADDLTLRYPEGWLLRGDAELTLQSSGGREGRQLRGIVDLERAFYLRDVEIGMVQLFQRFLSRERLEIEETDELLATTQLNVAIDGEGALRIRNNLADLGGDIELTLRGSLARPVVFGQVELESGGTLVYGGNEYSVERGLLTFANPYRLDPLVDLVARTEVRDYEVTLNLSGTTERLNASFSSNPPLPDLDVLGLLTTGSPVDERAALAPGGGPNDETGSLAAEGFLYGQAASLISERVNSLFGLDKFRIDPLPEAGGGVPSARVTVGKRLSKDVYATYSTDVASTEQQILQVEWQLSADWALVMTQNGDGSYSVDARWDKAF